MEIENVHEYLCFAVFVFGLLEYSPFRLRRFVCKKRSARNALVRQVNVII